MELHTEFRSYFPHNLAGGVVIVCKLQYDGGANFC